MLPKKMFNFIGIISLLYLGFFYSEPTLAQKKQETASQTQNKNEKESISPEAIESTQKVLRDKKSRESLIKESKAAQESDQKAGELAGSEENKEKMYDISADIMANFQGKSPEELQQIINEAQKNPEKFYKNLTPEQKAQIKNLADQIEASKKRP